MVRCPDSLDSEIESVRDRTPTPRNQVFHLICGLQRVFSSLFPRFLGPMGPGLTELVSKSIQNRQNPDNFCEVGVLTGIIFGNYCTESPVLYLGCGEPRQ